MPRRYDPERRQRIIDAAIRVVGRKGIAGLSHRTVAAEADVPLGSTTYHFATLDDLLVSALRQASEGFAKVIAARGGLSDPGADLAGELAGLMGEWLAGDRTGVELEYELYLAALRRPALRPVAAEWADDLAALLARRTDPVTARALVALMDGICLQALLTGTPYDEAYAREVLARVIGRPAVAPGSPPGAAPGSPAGPGPRPAPDAAPGR
ncbi:TetR/AcrR family transcriptional regulator [Streptomyces mexicanus]|jgi:DNA-binding transcriptional regulator YbjK|uniref:TetR family transcriptional regulator n=1 Tax=Streptomyces mexicanus TaxID=178566 RepID=A0A7X1I0H7_9ACTN|nr:TetR family transcriptional regulator [Streptomyces mexicanus]MBC2866446.1 TetR family transcriptional regulator [Streptomyces mexicanus]